MVKNLQIFKFKLVNREMYKPFVGLNSSGSLAGLWNPTSLEGSWLRLDWIWKKESSPLVVVQNWPSISQVPWFMWCNLGYWFTSSQSFQIFDRDHNILTCQAFLPYLIKYEARKKSNTVFKGFLRYKTNFCHKVVLYV